MRLTKFDRVRIYETLRTAHLERAQVLPPSSILYRSKRYDFDPVTATGLDLLRVRTSLMALVLIRSPVRTLEINEPMMRVGLRRSAVALAAVGLTSLLRRRRVIVVSYAIENRDPFTTVQRSLRGRLGVALDRRLSLFAARRVDKFAYGTDASRELYEQVMGPALRRASTIVIPAIPRSCECDVVSASEPGRVLFLGALERRKGFDRLMAVWPSVTAKNDPAHLQIVGKGTMEHEARTMATSDPSVSVLIDPPRAEIHRQLRRAAVLVLLSVPTADWREQVGLPIVEGLAHGCVIVTTTETGLAQWLSAHGHTVVSPEAGDSEILAAIVDAVSASTRMNPKRDLPSVDGRLAADAWLFGDAVQPEGQSLMDGLSGSETDPREE